MKSYISNKLKEKVKKRYNNKCVICGKNKSKIIIHHIDGVRKNNTISNLLPICYFCHIGMHRYFNDMGFECSLFSLKEYYKCIYNKVWKVGRKKKLKGGKEK